MDESIRLRLKTISNSVESLISSGLEVLIKLKENNVTLEESLVTANKLKAMNNRFVSETYNYYKLVQVPSADDLSGYTAIQIQAEEIVAEIEVRCQASKQSSVINATSNTNLTSRLPQMELARFNGDILRWHQFWDQFSSNVDSRNINDVDKLLYLKSVLDGEAKQAVDGLDTTSTNYRIAVETLKERYGKPATIIDAHYRALFRIQVATSSIKECRNNLSEIERHLRVLQSLGEDVSHNHFRVMILEKFPEDLIYELRMKMGSEDESIENIRKGLEYIISAKETSNRVKGEMFNEKSTEEKFTLDTLHVRSDNIDRRRKFRNKGFLGHRIENRDKFNENRFNVSKLRKRSRDDVIPRQQYEPRPKKAKLVCIFCENNHFNDECTNVKTLQERKLKIKGRCYNCLGNGHRAIDCRNKKKCRHCGKFGLHNRALCPDKVEGQTNPTKVLHLNFVKGTTILQTAIVHSYKIGDISRHVNCRVLLDCGSQRSYITSNIVKELALPVIEENRLSVFTFGAKTAQEFESPVVKLRMVTRTNVSRVIYANVVPHISQNVPCPYGNILNINDILKYHKELVLADDGSREEEVDILLGNDYYHSFMSNNKIKVDNDLFLVKSDFGWVWSGKCPPILNNRDDLSVLTYFQSNKHIERSFYEPDLPLRNENLKQLWDLEAIGITDSPKASRDEEAVKKFNETTQYNNNRYYVKWPWTEYPPTQLPVNLGLAKGRLANLLKRLDSETILAYDEILKEQLQKGIIEEVSSLRLPTEHPVHYLPHHCVQQAGKSTKLRIVYDASAKSKDNCSLNECLYRGPLMLEDLTGLIVRFREHQIGIVADVEKAFLQIGLLDADRDVTRFLWIKDINKGVTEENLQHLRFCRVPFGVISSPFLLNATVRYHLIKSYEGINKIVADDIYVDNLVTGANTITEALSIYKITKETFNELSMNLREWNSNSKDFTNRITKYDRNINTTIKVLGILWDTEKDELSLLPDLRDASSFNTKRGVLKVASSIFDPCGFMAPIMLPAKLLIQDLWKQKLKWDEKLPFRENKKWQLIISDLQSIPNIKIPRSYFNQFQNSKYDKLELHCFADASKYAYAAVVYLRRCDKHENNILISFIIGKSRLTPIKNQNELQIPRLELLGAVIGNRLLQYVSKFLRSTIDRQILWVDSEIVLSWYNSEKLLPPFVARRVKEIKNNKKLNMRYVPTALNPADGATRSMNVISSNVRWLSGPEFLKHHSSKWPKRSHTENMLEQTKTLLAGEGSCDEIIENTEINEEEDRSQQQNYYKLRKLDKEMDINQEKVQITNSETEYQVEINDEIKEIQKVQKEHFPKEIKGIKTSLSKSLNLFKEKKGLLRCGGRFKNTDWEEDKKYPILLQKNSDFTIRIIETVHKGNYHVGVSHTLALTRNRFWIIQGRSQVQKVLRQCLSCRKYGGGPYKIPSMPPLPPERVRYSTPFSFTGLDYFGPLKVNDGQKRWICLFTCLAVRAIHMEVVTDLSADECVLAIRRFVATRGLPKVITSDNATQFKLASEVIISDYCVKNEISWRFIPELAPWFGGFYERLIGIVKNCLKRTLDKHLLTHNQLCTIIKELEAVVNTRPLTTVGPELEQVLTPADFLRIGGPLLTEVSEHEYLVKGTVAKENLIEGWKRGQVILQEYVKMFVSQYLTSLRERRGSNKQSRVNVSRVPQLGDVVQIKSDLSRALWKVGRISAVIKGSDGQIRVAKVTMPSGETLTRAIAHLYPLEINDGISKGVTEQKTVQSVQFDSDINRDSESHTPVPRLVFGDHTPPLQTPALESAVESEHPAFEPDNPHTIEVGDHTALTRPKRVSAQKAKEKIKLWTQQLLTLIF